MNSKTAGAVLLGLLYAQGLLGFAGLALVLLKDRVEAAPVVLTMDMQAR